MTPTLSIPISSTQLHQEKPHILILSIGDELITANRANTTAPLMTAALTALGFNQIRILTIKDEEKSIIGALDQASENIIITTGGLGSTGDDNTVAWIATALGKVLCHHIPYEKRLKKMLKNQNVTDPKIVNRFLQQAFYPQGFQVQNNPYGSAPFLFQKPDNKSKTTKTTKKINTEKFIFLLPGVPSECIPLFKTKIIPMIRSAFKKKAPTVILDLKIVEISETQVEDQLLHLIESINPKLLNTIKRSYLPSNGEVLLRLEATSKLKPQLTKIRNRLRKAFNKHLTYSSAEPLSLYLHRVFVKHQIKVGFVESCTGGLIASEFIQYPGSSQYFDAGLITYSGEAKKHFAQVPQPILKQHGEVSHQTAIAMASGLAKKRKLHLTLSTTGVAGPSGGSQEKPVGLIYLGICYQPPHSKKKIELFKKLTFLPRQGRNIIRQKTVKAALIFISKVLKQQKLI